MATITMGAAAGGRSVKPARKSRLLSSMMLSLGNNPIIRIVKIAIAAAEMRDRMLAPFDYYCP